MKKILKHIRRKMVKRDVADLLKKKAALCSAEAAAISVVVHVLIIAFAGSIVAYEYIKRRDAAFEGQNVNRPKLERRQLQMPVKVQNLQKKSRRPKVSTRMASTSKSSLALPNMSALGMGLGKGSGGDGFDRSAAAGGQGGERELSSMGAAGSLGFGISSVNFFGAKSKGEKIVFIVDTTKSMVVDEKGGYYTYKFAKDRIRQMVDKMKAATLFNVILYGGKHNATVTAMFSTQLLPATTENKEALKAWIKPVNSDPHKIGQIEDLENYSSDFEYETPIETRSRSWLKAAQAAMEQKADNIFILAAGWGRHSRPVDKSTIGEWLEERGWPPKRVEEFEKLKDEQEEKALELLEKENKARAKKGLPPRIVAQPWRYIEEKQSQLPRLPPGPPSYQPETGWGYTYDEIIEHLDGVYEYNYIPEKLKKPQIHFVQLIAADAAEGGDSDEDAERLMNMRRVTRAFKGDFEFLRGANTMEDILKYNRTLDEE